MRNFFFFLVVVVITFKLGCSCVLNKSLSSIIYPFIKTDQPEGYDF